MSKIGDALRNTRVFCNDVVTEVKKTTCPARQEQFESTVMVVVSVILMSAFVGVSDKILVTLLKVLVR